MGLRKKNIQEKENPIQGSSPELNSVFLVSKVSRVVWFRIRPEIIFPSSRAHTFISSIVFRYFGHDNIIPFFGEFCTSFSFIEFLSEKISSFFLSFIRIWRGFCSIFWGNGRFRPIRFFISSRFTSCVSFSDVII